MTLCLHLPLGKANRNLVEGDFDQTNRGSVSSSRPAAMHMKKCAASYKSPEYYSLASFPLLLRRRQVSTSLVQWSWLAGFSSWGLPLLSLTRDPLSPLNLSIPDCQLYSLAHFRYKNTNPWFNIMKAHFGEPFGLHSVYQLSPSTYILLFFYSAFRFHGRLCLLWLLR